MQVAETGEVKPQRLGCPANPKTIKMNLEKIGPILAEYDLDGFHFEDCFVYYRKLRGSVELQDPPVCFCDYCRQHAPVDPEERQMWNRAQLTEMLRKIVDESKKHSPRIKIAVSARTPLHNALSHSTDWKEWCELGLLDYITPMIYDTDNARIWRVGAEILQMIAPSRVPVYIGLGAFKLGNEFKGHELPFQTAGQIAITRELKANGQIFYHMGGIKIDQWIQMGEAYRERAVPPYLER